ncbi:hypothetical protein [Loktanella sp. Alg231-35]|uniref:hypothetical protein n=1 Tax=Loktanella sp. Alg231-35 TaxID=1922220 RepID=UPI000D554060|nr:hypothetical protein [Loktanella sp. Alg231-35]
MKNMPIKDPQAMSGHVQGFELPRGCMMTSGVIALAVLTFAVGVAYASTLGGIVGAIALPIIAITGYAQSQPIGRALPSRLAI